MLLVDGNILDVSSGVALVDKTPKSVKALIENLPLNSKHLTTRNNSLLLTRVVDDIQAFSTSNENLGNKLDELTSLVKHLAVGKSKTMRVCGICTSFKHPTYLCPTLQDSPNVDFPQAYVANVYNHQPNNYDMYNKPYLSTNRYHPS